MLRDSFQRSFANETMSAATSNAKGEILRTKTKSNLFFFTATPTTEIYTSIDTLSLHDALPIFFPSYRLARQVVGPSFALLTAAAAVDRKSTRLNSSHQSTSRMPSSA